MAYNVATLVQKDPVGSDQRVHVVIEFTGNAGEPTVRRDYYLDGDTTAISLRRWAIAEAGKLASRKTLADNLTVGQSINLTPIAESQPTAKELWLREHARLGGLVNGVTLTGTAATALSTAIAAHNAAFQAGYLDA